MKTYESERLRYISFHRDYAQDLYELDANPGVMRYLGGVKVSSLEQTLSMIDDVIIQYEKYGMGRFLAIEKESRKCIGWTGLKWIDVPFGDDMNYIDLGYRFKPEFWGKRYATESATWWKQFAEEHFPDKRLRASAHVDNIGSRKALQNAGFKEVKDKTILGLPCVWLKP